MKTKLTILQFIAKHGEEKTAFKLLDERVINLYGLSILDLPDTCEIAEICEELSDQLKNDPTDKEAIKSIIHIIDMDFIEHLIFN
jgi:hypothetical protein